MKKLKIYFNKVPAMRTYYNFSMLIRGLHQCLKGKMTRGPAVTAFEREMSNYCGCANGKAFPHARVALYYALKSLNLPKNSEVILPPFTIADFVKVIVSLDLKPVFVDINPNNYSADIKQFKSAISNNSKVFIMTYLFGITPNIDEYLKISKENNLYVIEDFSQNLGCTYNGKKIGSFGDLGIVSLSSLKTCGTFFGGIAVSNDKEIINKMSSLSEKELVSPSASVFSRLIIKSLFYDILTTRWLYSFFTFYIISFINKISPSLHYKLLSGNIGVILGEEKIPERESLNPDMFTYYTDFQAREGLRILRSLDKNDDKRIKLYNYFSDHLSSEVKANLATLNTNTRNTYWRLPLKTKNLKKMKKFLLDNYIETSVNYLPNCSNIKFKGWKESKLPEASNIDENLMILPLHQTMSKEQVLYMANVLNNYYRMEHNAKNNRIS